MTSKKKDRPFTRRDILFGAAKALRKDQAEYKTGAEQTREKSLLTRADQAFSRHDYARAVRLYRDYMKENTQDMRVRRRFSYSLYKLKHYVQARVELWRVQRHCRQDDFCCLLLGLTFLGMNKREQAIEELQQYISSDQKDFKETVRELLNILEDPDGDLPEEHILLLEQNIHQARDTLIARVESEAESSASPPTTEKDQTDR